MKKVIFIIEKTDTGYSAYHENSNGIVATTGDNIAELKTNILEAYNLQRDYYHKKPVGLHSLGLAFEMGA